MPAPGGANVAQTATRKKRQQGATGKVFPLILNGGGYNERGTTPIVAPLVGHKRKKALNPGKNPGYIGVGVAIFAAIPAGTEL